MKIWTELESVNDSGLTKVGVHIESQKSECDGIIDTMIDGVITTMEIVGILRALKDYDNKAFNLAMQHFIEEELTNGKSVC